MKKEKTLDLSTKKFNLFGCTWTIVYKDKVDDIDIDENTFCWGLCDATRHVITIAKKDLDNKSITKDRWYYTLCHEITHAILDEGSYNELSGKEELVEWIAKCLASLIRQNVI